MSKNLLSKLEAKLNTGELFEIVDNSLAASQVLYALGYAKKGQYISIVKQYLIDNDIDTSHFTSNGKPALKLIKRYVRYVPVLLLQNTDAKVSK